MSDLPNLDAAHAAEPNMADLRHTWEPWGRYTCPACGEALLKRDPNDLCPAKVALRLATADTLTRERDDMRHGFESCARLASWLSNNRAALSYDGCGMAGDEAIVLIQRLVGERDEARAALSVKPAVVVTMGAGWTEERLRLEREIDRKGEVIESLAVERDEARAALAEAEAAGWRRGMEEAAKVCNLAGNEHDPVGPARSIIRRIIYDDAAERIRNLLTADAKVTT